MDPRRVSDDEPVLWLGDDAGEVSIFLSLLIVVCFGIPPSSSLSLSTASRVITPLRRVSLSGREISML